MDKGDQTPDMIPPEHQLWAIGGAFSGILVTLAWGRSDVWDFLSSTGGLIGGIATAISVIAFVRLTYIQLDQQKELAEDTKKTAASPHASLVYSKLSSYELHIDLTIQRLLDVCRRREDKWWFHNDRLLIRTYNPETPRDYVGNFRHLAEMLSDVEAAEEAASHLTMYDTSILASISELKIRLRNIAEMEDWALKSLNYVTATNVLMDIVISWTKALTTCAEKFDVETAERRAAREDKFPEGSWLSYTDLLSIAASNNPPVDWGNLKARAEEIWLRELKMPRLPTSPYP